MKVNIETCEPKVTLELTAREAQVIEQALFLTPYTFSAFSHESKDLGTYLGATLDAADIELLDAGTQ